MYIHAASAIAPQKVFRQPDALQQLTALTGNRYIALEPEYTQLIDPKLIRRMSRIIRMGVATALDALNQADLRDPSAIITGTAYGCLEDTGIFLKRLVENKEEMLAPTAFIQSTHNTIGAQIALLLQCHSYNTTYVQRSHSFESALLDTQLLLQEDPAALVLAGAAEETTPESYAILQRFGRFRQQASGEGACYFVAGATQRPGSFAKLSGIRMLYQPDEMLLEKTIRELLAENGLEAGSVDLLLTGNTEQSADSPFYGMVEKAIFSGTPTGHYKRFCGEYPTASAFACWLAASMLKLQQVPESVASRHSAPLRSVLLYNHDAAGYHSLMLLTAC